MKNIILVITVLALITSLSSCSRRSLLIGSYMLSKNNSSVRVTGNGPGYVTVDLKRAGNHTIKSIKGDGVFYEVNIRKSNGAYSNKLGVVGSGREFSVPEAGSYVFTVDGVGKWTMEID